MKTSIRPRTIIIATVILITVVGGRTVSTNPTTATVNIADVRRIIIPDITTTGVGITEGITANIREVIRFGVTNSRDAPASTITPTRRKLAIFSMFTLPLSKTEVPVSRCDVSVCKQFRMFCQNGGECKTTRDCGVRCLCKPGFTGFFCGINSSDVYTTRSSSARTR